MTSAVPVSCSRSFRSFEGLILPEVGHGQSEWIDWNQRIGNAIFDATGARLRDLPFTPERVKDALNAAFTGK